jgi:hypothetical protein
MVNDIQPNFSPGESTTIAAVPRDTIPADRHPPRQPSAACLAPGPDKTEAFCRFVRGLVTY